MVEEEELKGKIDKPEKEGPSEGEFIRRPGKEPMIEEAIRHHLLAPYPQRLKRDRQETKSQQFLELFKQVKINLPLLEVIK